MIALCREREWWPNINPQRPGSMDVAGRQSHGGDSNEEIWRKLAGFRFAMRHVRIHEGIDRLATFPAGSRAGS